VPGLPPAAVHLQLCRGGVIRLRYQARLGYWWVDLLSLPNRGRPKRKAVFREGRVVKGKASDHGLWTGPWRTARGAVTLDLANDS
jgi:hypothetical protein